MYATAAQFFQIFLGRRMIPHVDVHCRGDDDRSSAGEIQRAEKIIADAAAEFGEDVRGGWRDQQKVGALGHGDVFDGAFQVGLAVGFGEQSSNNFFSGERGKGERSDEFAGRASHHYFD